MARNNFKFAFIVLFFLCALFFCGVDAATTSNYFKIEKGCGVIIEDAATGRITCNPWQRGSQMNAEGVNAGLCICANTCLSVPKNHYYYNDPVARTRQNNESEITLPVVLAWDNIDAWQKESGEYLWQMLGVGGKESVKSKIFGARSYVLEIDNTDNVLLDSESSGRIFRRVLKTNEFNPAKDLYPCFFNSDTVIKWRVMPCCNDDGSDCLPRDQAAWWKFKTSPAPEPINIRDADWNGPGGAKDISYKDLRLDWCRANVSAKKQPYNDNMELSLSYQLRVYTNEARLVLADAQIPEKFSNLASWLKKDVPALPDPLSCHYLEKQSDNTCKADIINPVQPKTPRNYWSHKELPNDDRALFTKNITYSWQLRRCFNNPSAGDESCSSASDKYWGQLWKFTAKNEIIESPAALLPENDPDYGDSQIAMLTELPGSLSWQVPDGANSFAYDIQEINGANSRSLVDGEDRVTVRQIDFPENKLKLDTAYKWRVKSCWPAIPVGNVCDEPWSQWQYFRTTGRAPKTASMVPANGAIDLALPVNLQWEAVPGAKSYIVDFGGKKINTTANQYVLDYPEVGQSKSYGWKVQTCADAAGRVCGIFGPEFTFATAALGASKNPIIPGDVVDNGRLIYDFSWEPVAGARYYKFVLDYKERSGKETNDDCVVGKKVEKIVKGSATTVSKDIEQLYCFGGYDWSVLACLDQDCHDTGPAPSIWNFNFVAGGKEIKQGETVLAVCGLTNDNPNTAWDDREPCSIKHMLLAVEQTINFILFKVSVILLPLLVLATGVMFYSRFGGTETKQRMIGWWRVIGIGYVALFFSWVLVGVLLGIFGYSGVWWSI